MKILLLMKRFSTNRDMILENFGREVRLYSEMNKLGQNVTVLCADQQKKERITTKLNGMKVEICPFGILNIFKFAATARRMAAENEVVVGATHPLLGFIAHLAAKASGKKMVYDLRDNYDMYNFTNLPLLKRGIIPRLINRHIFKSSDLVVCVSETLKQKISAGRKTAAVVVQNGVSTKLFRPLNKEKCRKSLGLPAKAPIIAYTGHISKERGSDILIEAFKTVREKIPEAVLLLSGQVDRNIRIDQPGIVYEKLPRRKEVVIAINSADVAVVPHPENEITKYGIPYKLLEYMACNVPVVATRIDDIKEVLKDHPESLAEPGNAQDLAQKILAAIASKKKPNYRKIVEQYAWEKLARKLNSELVKLRH